MAILTTPNPVGVPSVTPAQSGEENSPSLVASLNWYAAALTVAIFLLGVFSPRFSVDSWSYLELSNSVFNDFYRINTVRQFDSLTAFGTSFPPLWPILIASTRKILDIGIYTGVLLNLGICLLLIPSLTCFVHSLRLPRWAGAALYLALIGYSPFLDEALAARSMPLSILLLVASITLLSNNRRLPALVASVGLLMGLNCLNRFDALPIALTFSVLIAGCGWSVTRDFRKTLVVVVIYSTVILATLSPWIAFNYAKFGKPFASDNSRQLAVAERAYVTDYFDETPDRDLTSDPLRWLSGLLRTKLPVWLKGCFHALAQSSVPLLLGLLVILRQAGYSRSLSPELRWLSAISATVIPAMVLPSMAVGYGDERYFTAAIVLLYATLGGWLIVSTREAWNARAATSLVLVISAPVLLGGVIAAVKLGRDRLNSAIQVAPLSETGSMQVLRDRVARDAAGKPYRLIDTDATRCAMFGALTGEPASLMPKFTKGTFESFVRNFGITHVYDPDGLLAEVQLGRVTLVPLDLKGLYRLNPIAP